MAYERLNFIEWFDSLKHSHNIHNTFEEAVIELAENDQLEYTSYMVTQTVENKLERDEDGKFFVEFALPRNNNDISTDFSFSPHGGKISLVINDRLRHLPYTMTIVPACAMYTELKIRLTYDVAPSTQVKVTYVSHLLKTELRKDLMNKKFVLNDVAYLCGLAQFID